MRKLFIYDGGVMHSKKWRIHMKVRTRELWFYSAFGLTLLRNFVTNSIFFEISNKILLIIIILYGFSMLYRKIDIKDITLCVYGLLTYFISKEVTFLYFLFVIVASKGIEKDKIILFWLKLQTGILGFCIIFYPIFLLFGSPYAVANVIDGRLRYYFFFSHPNNFGISLAFSVMAYIYVHYRKLSYNKVNIILILSAIFIYIFPNSRSAALALFIFMLFLFLMRNMPLIWKIGMTFILPALFMFSVFFVWRIFRGGILLNNNFVSRFMGISAMLNIYPLNIFGHYIDQIGKLVNFQNNWINLWGDVAYIRIFITFGIVGGIFFLKKLSFALYTYLKEGEYLRVNLLAIVCIYGVLEWSAFQIMISFPLIFIADALDQKKIRRMIVKP